MLQKTEIKIPVVFMGTSLFAARILDSLIQDKYNIVAVFTQPDRKIGRDQSYKGSPVKELAIANGLAVYQPERFDEPTIAGVKKLKPDLILVAAYGKILPEGILNIPGLGCVNVHTSLLPKFRGPSPIQNAILAGETETGVTLIQMDKGIDTGDIISQKSIPINASDTAASLDEKLSSLGSSLLRETLPPWIKRKIETHPQNNAEAILCQLIEREGGHIAWTDSAQSILNRFRAFTPWPGIYAIWESDNSLRRLKLLGISIADSKSSEEHHLGEVFNFDEKIGVQSADGVILLDLVQLENKQPISIKDFINGYPRFVGSILR